VQGQDVLSEGAGRQGGDVSGTGTNYDDAKTGSMKATIVEVVEALETFADRETERADEAEKKLAEAQERIEELEAQIEKLEAEAQS